MSRNRFYMIKIYGYATQGFFFSLFNLGTPVEEARLDQVHQWFSSVVPGPAAEASLGNTLKMQSPGHTPTPDRQPQKHGSVCGAGEDGATIYETFPVILMHFGV